ncbi:hypothetical protein C2G38_2223020 [Gigaspora rosea]|uniref:F-box domain-containing protein n=1 Tax=Gigaspora rosea TaxID=44941 RepID=A0A397UAN6_9GLOM|nr:hypothetical protein C2G38_2223020 [Gigaspora rosea]
MSLDTNNRSKIPMNLPTDCLVEVLRHLKYDITSLYSCILVNRLWCKFSIPLLWCSPFEFTRHNNKSELIIQTYVSCFSEEEKNQFYDKVFLIPDFQELAPTFNYPSYLHNLDIPTFESAVRNWFHGIWKNYAPESSKFSLSTFSICKRIIGHMLFDRSIGFRALKMSRDEQDHTFYFDILTNSGIHHRLSQLQRFELCYNVTRNNDAKLIVEGIIKLFSTLSRYVHKLNHISFIFGTESPILQLNIAKSFADLIKSQNKLKSLELYKFWDQSTANEIYSALNSQSNSLECLKILGAKDFIQMLPFLESCSKLETLYITPSIINSEIISWREIPLKNLYFHHYTEPRMITSTMSPILRMSTKTLTSLTLQRVNLEHLNIIEKYCQLLKSLTLSISCSQLSRFCKIISLMELESLTLKKVLDDLTFDITSVQDLALSIPKSLINFGIGFKMTPQTLALFLRKCRAKLIGLDLYYYFNMIDDSYLEIFIQHAKENNCFERLNFEEAPSTHLRSVLDRPSKLLEHAKNIISIKKFKFGANPSDDIS